MADLFLVASGGTGMRCLQSFIQMAAFGMFPGKSIHILLLETDEENKDKRNTENLFKWYEQLTHKRQTKQQQENDKSTNVGSFFSAQIKLYTFVPDYSNEATRNFVVLSQVERGNSAINRKLSNIFYEEGVQEFNLSHGYRAQTHLGSYLMYHAIINEIRQAMSNDGYKNNSDLWRFINTVQNNTKDGAKVFVVGSTFGGTGASSIPIITRAITDSCKLLTDDKIQMANIYYGSVVLSDYFKFDPPSDEHKKKDKVIAQSEFFEHNSASALMYYVNNPTILATYKKLYLLGWGSFKKYHVDLYKKEYLNLKEKKETATGGKSQTNPAHILELFAAFAAKHFFDEQTTKVSELESIKRTKFLYKALEADANIPEVKFEDLYTLNEDGLNNEDDIVHNKIKKNIVSFTTLAAIINIHFDRSISNLLVNLKRYNINYSFTEAEKEAIDNFLEYFYDIKADSSMTNPSYPGWIRQLYLTFHGESGSPGSRFFGLSGDVFGKNPKNWFSNFKNLSDNTDKAVDLLVAKLIALNKTSKKNPHNFVDFVDHFRDAISSFEIIDGLKKQVD